MNFFINLIKNDGFTWSAKDGIWVKGFLFDSQGNFYQRENLCDYFNNISDSTVFVDRLKDANGHFSIVIETAEHILCAVDRVRSLPLFIAIDGSNLTISDDARKFDKETICTPDRIMERQFELTGYVLGNNTLFSAIKQLQGGELLIINKTSENQLYTFKKYYEHLHLNFFEQNEENLLKKCSVISNNIFKRLIESVGSAKIILPLSGGYDSRYIAVMLKKLGYTNVLCYTYGRKESHEVSMSQKVAQTLGFEWIFVEYTDDLWQMDKKFVEYLDYSHNYSSLPHIQEFYALEYLTSHKLIPAGSVFVPGFCGDLLGGSFLIEEDKLAKIESNHISLAKYIFHKHFNLCRCQGKYNKEIISDITKYIEDYKITCKDDLISINEHFFTLHKVTKFIVNSLRVYEFFGFEWRMPLWDNELIDFWYKIPNEKRRKSRLYNNYLLESVFKPYKLDIRKKESFTPASYIKAKMPDVIKKPILYIINKYLLKNSRDFNSFNGLANRLVIEINSIKNRTEQNRTESIYTNENINYFLARWYLARYCKGLINERKSNE